MNSTFILKFLVYTVGRLPLKYLRGLGVLCGYLMWLTSSRMKQVSRENIELSFPLLSAPQKRLLARQSLLETGKTIVETLRYWRLSPDACLADIVEVDDQIENGHGNLVFVIPHLGNWELLNHYLGKHYTLTHMYLPAKSRKLDTWILACRKKSGNQFVAADKKGIREQWKHLKTGGNIGQMPDQEPETSSGIFCSFFGQQALTGTVLPRFLLEEKSQPVIATCCRSSQGFRVQLRSVAPASRLSLFEAAQIMNREMEASIKEQPEQYLWSYKRFRTRPAGEIEIYQTEDSLISQLMIKILLTPVFRLCAWLPLSMTQQIGKTAGRLISMTRLGPGKIARINLRLCMTAFNKGDQNNLKKQCLEEMGKTALETGWAWKSDRRKFYSHLQVDIKHREQLDKDGSIILTPPLGNREVVFRYLSDHYRLNEYYHPHPVTGMDSMIRKQRANWGIELYPHCDDSIQTLLKKLDKGELVSLCPDQQPRLRTGEFVPFFGHPALTPLALYTLASLSQAKVFFACAIRQAPFFRLRLVPFGTPLPTDAETDEKAYLKAVNRKLEELIIQNPEQYRWTDKRFNIQPRGSSRPYRRSKIA